MDARAVNEGHTAHTDDTHLGFVARFKMRLEFIKLVGDAKEVRAVDFIDRTALGNKEVFFVHVHIGLGAGVNLVLDNGDFRGFHHTLDEQCRSDDQTNLYGNRQVEDNGQEEGDEQHGHVALGILEESAERAPATHVVADHDKHCRQRSHGDVLGQGHQHQQDEQQHHGMDDTRHRRAAAIVDIRHGTGNGTRGRNTAKERRDKVGHALGHEFGVAVVAVANHTISHGGREQTLNGTQNGNGEGHGHQVAHSLEGERWDDHIGQFGLNVKAVANGIYACNTHLVEHEDGSRAKQNAVERARNLIEHRHTAEHGGREDDDEQRTYGHDEIPQAEGADILRIGHPLADEVAGRLEGNLHNIASLVHSLLREAQHIAHLRSEDGHGDTCREANDDGMGNKLDDCTQLEHA